MTSPLLKIGRLPAGRRHLRRDPCPKPSALAAGAGLPSLRAEGDPHAGAGADGQRGPDPLKAEKANGEGSPRPFSANAQMSRSRFCSQAGHPPPRGATPFLSGVICLYSPPRPDASLSCQGAWPLLWTKRNQRGGEAFSAQEGSRETEAQVEGPPAPPPRRQWSPQALDPSLAQPCNGGGSEGWAAGVIPPKLCGTT